MLSFVHSLSGQNRNGDGSQTFQSRDDIADKALPLEIDPTGEEEIT